MFLTLVFKTKTTENSEKESEEKDAFTKLLKHTLRAHPLETPQIIISRYPEWEIFKIEHEGKELDMEKTFKDQEIKNGFILEIVVDVRNFAHQRGYGILSKYFY